MLSINLPGSKSYTNRALLIASLAEGTSTLQQALVSDDTQHMVAALRSLGIVIEESGQKDDTTLVVHGRGGFFAPLQADEPIFIGNAGTAMRFLTVLCTLIPERMVLTGDERMQERPIAPLVTALRQGGCTITYLGNEGFPPLAIEGEHFPGGEIAIAGDTSSQYLSALLMVAPYAVQETSILLTSPLASRPYVDMTLDIMDAFGVTAINEQYERFIVPTAQPHYQGRTYLVEADASAASYFLTAAVIKNTPLTITNLGMSSRQGDVHLVDHLEAFGANVIREPKHVGIAGADIVIRDRIISMNTMPDVVQTLAMLAAITPARTIFTDIATLRVKETDRIAALENELSKLGVTVSSTNDSLTIVGKPADELHQEVTIDTYNDHRMAMSFAVLQLVLSGITIANPGCVAKTYPQFWDDFAVFSHQEGRPA